MKITGHWIDHPATQNIFRVFESSGYQALFVGGCVRNALLNVTVGDIDIATDATPDQVLRMTQKTGIKAIPTGIEHGTVTLVSEAIAHEVTTFRNDIETFGRRAKIEFSDDITQDARRRDFTMNALYARADGTVIDPLGGIHDLRAGRVRFIDDAGLRIREDYLRILRFFRFHAWYGDASVGLDAEGLAAIAENTEGLGQLSRERIGAEMLKLLSAPDPAPSVAAMRNAGVLGPVLPGADDRYLAVLVHLEERMGLVPDALRRLACIGGANPTDHLRLSKGQRRQLILLQDGISSLMGTAELGYRYGVQAGLDIVLLRGAMLEQPIDQVCPAELEKGASARLPVMAQDLMPIYTGPDLGARLKEIERRWIASGFTLTKQDLL